MFTARARAALLAITASIGLSGCTGYYGGLGSGVSVGVGNGYYGDPYGYGYGYGRNYGSYGSPYGYGYGSPYGYGAGYGYPGYGYGSPYYGWYDGYYYPGTGHYVYSPKGDRFTWTDAVRRYWQNRKPPVTGTNGTSTQQVQENWSGFRNNGTDRQRVRREERISSRSAPVRHSTVQSTSVRQERVSRQSERSSTRQDRQSARAERQQAREERRSNRDD